MKVLNVNPGITRRAAQIRLSSEGVPSSLDTENRSVQVVAATEEPAWVFNPDTWRMEREVLLMSGMREDGPSQIPLLDAHDRWSTNSVIGSARDFKVEGEQLLARTYFSSVDAAEEVFTKVREGHLTDVSIGYTVHAHVRVKDGETTEVAGREFEGPVLVAVDWSRKELSWCPIGADENAKARQEAGKKEKIMPPEKLKELRRRFNMPDASEADILAEMEKRAFAGGEAQPSEQPANPDPSGQDGQRSDPPLNSAPAAHQATPPTPAADGADFSRSDAAEIVSVCNKFGMSERAADFIAQGVSVTEVYRQCSDALLGQAQQQDMPAQRMEYGPAERDKFRQAAIAALELRSGLSTDYEAAAGLGGYSCTELGRKCLVINGENPDGHSHEVIGRALTTSDFPIILGDTANRSLQSGYEAENTTHEIWCDTSGVLTDFRPKELIQVGEFDDLDEILEREELEFGSMGEDHEFVVMSSFGKLLHISRRALVNDDLSVFSDAAQNMGRAAKRKEADLPYSVLLANANMSDGKALFHTDHKNIASTGAVVSVGALDTAFGDMSNQKGISGNANLNITPLFYIAPKLIQGQSEQFFKTVEIGGKTNQPGLVNIYAGDVLTRVYESRLNVLANKGWYLAGRKGQTVKMFFLGGKKKPTVESRRGWSRDGMELKVLHDCAAAPLGYKSLYHNPGEAS